MRAAMALSSLLQTAQDARNTGAAAPTAVINHVWRADEMSVSASACPSAPSGFAALDAELPGGGWPRGQLIELLIDRAGIGELSLLAPALVQATREQRACVWVLPCSAAGPAAANQDALPYAPALQAAGVSLARHIFVKPATTRETFWTVEQSLRATHLGVLICWLPASSNVDTEFRALRRLHLLASHSRTLVFALRAPHCVAAPSPAALRLQLAPHDGQLQVRILKRRGRPLLEPVALQIHPAHWTTARVPDMAAMQGGTTNTVPSSRLPSLPRQRWSLQALFAH